MASCVPRPRRSHAGTRRRRCPVPARARPLRERGRVPFPRAVVSGRGTTSSHKRRLPPAAVDRAGGWGYQGGRLSFRPARGCRTPGGDAMAFLNPVRAVEPLLLSVTSRLRWLPPALARLILGWVFLWSGWGKLHALDDIIDFFRSLGIPAPQLQAPFVAGVEFVCGALLLAGLFTRLAAVPLVIVMIVAIITAKRE